MATTLRAGALSLFESIVMGVAGSAPGFSIATTAAALLAVAGTVSVNALIIFALPMLGIAVAYHGLNRRMPRAGAAYDWTTQSFGRLPGFFSGWAVLISTLVFMVSGSLTLGSNLMNIVDPAATGSQFATTVLGAICYLAIGLVLISGIGITSKVQVVLTSIEMVVLAVIAIAAYVHAGIHGAVQTPSLAWLGFGYTPSSFAATALVVVFFYWGWDVTCNLGEETTDHPPNAAGVGGVLGVFLIIGVFVAFIIAAQVLFSMKAAQSYNVNIVYEIARAAGLGVMGAKLASFAVVLSSIATLETAMLQFSRSLFSMGRDRAMPTLMGVVDRRTETPVRAMALLIGLGLIMIFLSSLVPTVGTIVTDSVNAVAVQVCTYYGLAGLVCAWVYRGALRESSFTFLAYFLYPLLSAVALIVLGLYAITTFDTLTKVVGIGGLLLGAVFYRPAGWRIDAPAAAVAE